MSSRPAKVATVVGEGIAALLCGLPDEIVVWEILLRLPPKALHRCRAVSRSWLRAASTRDLLLAHNSRQPSLPLVSVYKHGRNWDGIGAFDHRLAANAQFELLARLDGSIINVQASCDGLLVLWVTADDRLSKLSRHFICNPVTRHIARLQYTQLHGFAVVGLYPHGNAGDYRLLLRCNDGGACYVASLGRDPRRIRRAPEPADFFSAPVLVRGNLHWTWSPLQNRTGFKTITVFNTAAESFRFHQLQPPMADTCNAHLFEMDGTLGMYGYGRYNSETAVDIWEMQDYESEVWAHKYRVELPLAQIPGCHTHSWRVVLGCEEGRALLLLFLHGQVLQVDVEGNLLASSRYDDHRLVASRFCIKQSLVMHTFFSNLQGAGNIAWPFSDSPSTAPGSKEQEKDHATCTDPAGQGRTPVRRSTRHRKTPDWLAGDEWAR